MKLNDALANGLFLGLDTTEEAIMDINIHAGQYFAYEDISKEIGELIKDLKALPNANTFITYTETGKIKLIPNILIEDYFPEAVLQADKMWEEYEHNTI